GPVVVVNGRAVVREVLRIEHVLQVIAMRVVVGDAQSLAVHRLVFDATANMVLPCGRLTQRPPLDRERRVDRLVVLVRRQRGGLVEVYVDPAAGERLRRGLGQAHL